MHKNSSNFVFYEKSQISSILHNNYVTKIWQKVEITMIGKELVCKFK